MDDDSKISMRSLVRIGVVLLLVGIVGAVYFSGDSSIRVPVQRSSSTIEHHDRPAPWNGDHGPWDAWAASQGAADHKWRAIEAENGAVFAVDITSAQQMKKTFTTASAIIFDPFNGEAPLRLYLFDCQGHYADKTGAGIGGWSYAAPRSIAGQMSAIVCAQ